MRVVGRTGRGLVPVAPRSVAAARAPADRRVHRSLRQLRRGPLRVPAATAAAAAGDRLCAAVPGRCEPDPHHTPIDQAAAGPFGRQWCRVAVGASARRLASRTAGRGGGQHAAAFLGYAIECLLDLRDGTGWDSEYERDVWLLRRLGVAGHDGARLDFTELQPRWLRELVKRWCRWRMSCGVGLGQLRKDRIALVRLARLTPGLASSTDPSALDRVALEGYLARLAVELAHPKTRSSDIGAVTGFLHAVRQHRWASLPAEASCIPATIHAATRLRHRGRFPSSSCTNSKAATPSIGSPTHGSGC